jgi:uncharacterized protein YbaR (Trm112 family)
MVKKCIVVCALIFITFTSMYQLSAGRGGYLYCSNCSYKSGEIYLDCGQGSYSRIVFCPKCKEYLSVLSTIMMLDQGITPEPEDESQGLLCPVCNTACEIVDEGQIWGALQQNGKQTTFLPCPKCSKNTLYLKIEFLWD